VCSVGCHIGMLGCLIVEKTLRKESAWSMKDQYRETIGDFLST
jgi:hypothetical protein